ncbi:hypothetical protein TNCT_463121 [Trichonephila clavata]|uniref:Uncharacterized protein n=1 Tax=Trichonephila clavata TaxID=2740835 RepID=A0A8X6KKA7_TRICU|nr:hypothetical protein TNCT_463121 [Trichonephila clavata]
MARWNGNMRLQIIEGFNNNRSAKKKRVPGEIRKHFVNKWAKFCEPSELRDKLDEYFRIRPSVKRANQNEMSLSNTAVQDLIFKGNPKFKNDIQSKRLKLFSKHEA